MKLSTTVLFSFALLASFSASPSLVAASSYATPYAFSTLTGVSSIGSNDGPGAAARFYGPSAITCDANGNLYVADEVNNTLRKITPSGVVSTLAGTAGVRGGSDGTGPDARFNNPTGVAVDAAGNIYVADKLNHAVRKVSPAGVVTTFAGVVGQRGTADGTSTQARFEILGGAAIDTAGNIYVAEWVNNTVRKIAPNGTVTTLAGQPGVYGTADGVGTAATFMFPYSLALDANNNVWVGDLIGSLRKIAPDGTVTTVIPSSAGHQSITALAIAANGTLYFATGRHTIHRRATDGTVTLIAGAAGVRGATDGAGTVARLSNPFGLALDSAGNLFVADRDNNTIRKITADGTVSTLAGLAPDNATGTTDGTLNAARFGGLAQIAIAPTGESYVADAINSTIRKINRDGVVSTFAGKAGQRGNVDGTGDQARFDSPYGIALAADGNLYVSDAATNTIRKVSAQGVVTTLAGNANAAGADDGTGSAARFNFPAGLVAGLDGNIYVADRLNHTIRRITPTGVVTTFAGSLLLPGNLDGLGTAARFDTPEGLAQDAAGNLYVSHSVRHGSIRKIAPNGTVTTLAGGAGGDANAEDGTGSAARFNQPKALAVDASGNVFVADGENHVIRKVTPAGVVTTLAGLAEAAGSADGLGRKSRFLSPPGLALDRDGGIYVTSGTTIRKGIVAAAPRITTQPANASVNAGANAQLSVIAAAAPEPAYQWRLNGTAIAGATASTLTISAARTADAGDYTVVVSNELGSVTSNPATLNVTAVTTPTPASSGNGGGGGAPSVWFIAALLLSGLARRIFRS
ncbi:MAG: immunoglobulin domain-containing protein [Candidatus Didemnitutus sp.]|nr:immunoglobulin domain-containing protein [Candidatus Didemnitutus sp.]